MRGGATEGVRTPLPSYRGWCWLCSLYCSGAPASNRRPGLYEIYTAGVVAASGPIPCSRLLSNVHKAKGAAVSRALPSELSPWSCGRLSAWQVRQWGTEMCTEISDGGVLWQLMLLDAGLLCWGGRNRTGSEGSVDMFRTVLRDRSDSGTTRTLPSAPSWIGNERGTWSFGANAIFSREKMMEGLALQPVGHRRYYSQTASNEQQEGTCTISLSTLLNRSTNLLQDWHRVTYGNI